MTPSRNLTARAFRAAVPLVRIHLPPPESLRTIGSSAARTPSRSSATGNQAERRSSASVCWRVRAASRRQPQRFCGRECRTAFWTALRRWGDQAITDGVLTIAELKDGAPAACTLLQRGDPPWALPDMGHDPAAFTDTPLRFLVEVDRDLVAGLGRLGFIRSDERGRPWGDNRRDEAPRVGAEHFVRRVRCIS